MCQNVQQLAPKPAAATIASLFLVFMRVFGDLLFEKNQKLAFLRGYPHLMFPFKRSSDFDYVRPRPFLCATVPAGELGGLCRNDFWQVRELGEVFRNDGWL